MPWNLFPSKRPTISRTTIDLMFLFGLMVLFYGQPFLDPTKTSYGGDGFSLFLPSLDFFRTSIFNGRIPLWNPYTWQGAPFLAPFQSAVLYPPQFLGLVFSSTPQALNFGIFFSILWLSFGCYIFGRRALELERFPSLLMGVVMACSGFVGAHADHVNQLAAISWIPWILCESLILLRSPRIRHVLLLALCLGMQVLAGHPQYVAFTFAYLAALTICYFVFYYHRRRAYEPPAWVGIVLIFVAVFLGIGFGAMQILPALELSQLSIRQFDPPERMFNYSFPPRHLVTMVLPNAFGNTADGLHEFMSDAPYSFNFSEFTIYLGIGTLALALLAVFTLFREFPVRVFLLLAMLCFLGATGDFLLNGIPYQVVMMMLPGGEHFRVPARLMIFFNLSIAVLAAMGFNQMFYYLRERRRVRATALTPLRILVLVVIFFDLYRFSEKQMFRFNDPVGILEQQSQVGAYLAEAPESFRLFRQMDFVPYNLDFNRVGSPEFRQDRRMGAAHQLQRLQPNLNVLSNIAVLDGYEEGLLPTISWSNAIGPQGRHRRNLYSPTPDTMLLGLMNVRYVISDKPLFTERLEPILAQQSESFPWLRAHVTLYENRDYIPKFAWGKPIREAYRIDLLEVSERQLQGRSAAEEREGFLQYRRSENTGIAQEDINRARIDFHRPAGVFNRYTIRKPAQQAGEVLVSEAAYPGWICRYGDNKIPLKRVNAFMMQFYAPTDVETIEVLFEPYSFRLGLFVSCVFAMLLGMLVFFHKTPLHLIWRRRR